MLLLLLLISSGCDVNIPGCGKRSLPFFKPIPTPTPIPVPVLNTPTAAPSVAPAPGTSSTSSPAPAGQAEAKAASKQPTLETLTEMSISKPKAAPTATSTPTATPMEVEKIAYTTLENQKSTLWTMNVDGTNRMRLTSKTTNSWYPLWSPNGKMLAFFSDQPDGKINLFLAKKGSADLTQLTSYSDMAFENPKSLKPPISWSPKSDEITYVYHHQIWKVDLTTLLHVTLATVDPAYSMAAVEWAPHRDNKYIAYLVQKGLNYFTLMLVNPRLLDTLKLADTTYAVSDISWTPDARRVAYLVHKDSIYTASPETSIPKRIFWGTVPEIGPVLAYSPAESASPVLMTIAKKIDSDKDYRVALVDKPAASDADSGSLKFLTDAGVVNAVWSPDGSKILYVQNGELWVMDAQTGANKNRIAAIGIRSISWSKK